MAVIAAAVVASSLISANNPPARAAGTTPVSDEHPPTNETPAETFTMHLPDRHADNAAPVDPSKPKQEPTPTPEPKGDRANPDVVPPPAPAKAPDAPAAKPPMPAVKPPMPPPDKPAPVAAKEKPWLAPRVQKVVDKAIERGVEHLKKQQVDADLSVPIGLIALNGLALLECDVPASDAAVQRIARRLRDAFPRTAATRRTYDTGLTILFLDRLGDPTDQPLIVSLTLSLVAGQNPDGGWRYQVPILSEEEERNLMFALRFTQPRSRHELFTKDNPLLKLYAPPKVELFIQQEGRRTGDFNIAMEGTSLLDPMQAGRVPGSGAGDEKPDARKGKADGDDAKKGEPGAAPDAPGAPKPPANAGEALKALPPNLRQIPALQPPEAFQVRGAVNANARMNRRQTMHSPVASDNSNSQFAILGLWAGRRQRVPMDRALALVVWRYQFSQSPNGGWEYMASPLNPVHPQAKNQNTTGAGPLGLALGHGLVLRNGITDGQKVKLPANINAGLRFMAPHWRTGGREIDLYYLWSLNRVAMLYGVRTIDGKPWYEPGVAEILSAQAPDGSWRSRWLEQATPFALMFLKRSNLCHDLARTIQGQAAAP